MKEKFKQLLKKAEEGDSLSQYELAMGYLSGEATGTPSISEGLEWINRFGEEGTAEIKCICGNIFKNLGWYSDAASWFRKASSAGSSAAKAELAAFYLSGVGDCSKNASIALHFAQEAFANGEKTTSPMILATLHLQGDVIEQDAVKAYKYLKIAAENGNEEAPAMIKKMVQALPQLRNL